MVEFGGDFSMKVVPMSSENTSNEKLIIQPDNILPPLASETPQKKRKIPTLSVGQLEVIPAKKKSKVPEKHGKLGFLETCRKDAKEKKHPHIIKFGKMKSSRYENYATPELAYHDFSILREPRSALEHFSDSQERMLYFDLDGYTKDKKHQTYEFQRKIIYHLCKIVEKLLKVVPKCITFECCRLIPNEEKKHGGFYKLSFHIVFFNIKCRANESIKPFAETVMEEAKQDEEASQYLEIEQNEDENSKSLIDLNVYNSSGSLRMAFSWKNEAGEMMRYFKTPFDIDWRQYEFRDQKKLQWCASMITATAPRMDEYEHEIPIIEIPRELTQKKYHIRDFRFNVSGERIQKTLEILQKLVVEKFPEDGKGYLVQETESEYSYKIHTVDDYRVCPHGKTHTSVGAVFRVYENRVEYQCFSGKCVNEDHLNYYPKELALENEKWKLKFNVLKKTDLRAVGEIHASLFKLITIHFRNKIKKLGLKDKVPLTEENEELITWLMRQWRHEVHALINHFVVRIENNSAIYSVTYTYQSTPYGRVFKCPQERSCADMKIWKKEICFDIPVLDMSDNQTQWAIKNFSLAQYLTSSVKGCFMEAQDKISYSNVEWYPALPDQDQRTPEMKKRNLNLFLGLLIWPKENRKWFNKLSDAEKAQVEKDIAMLEWIHRNALCAGDEKFHTYALRFAASKYFYPWMKYDANIVLSGPQGIGKSVIYSNLYHQLFGPNHAMTIVKIEDIDSNFNSHLATKLVLSFEEVNGSKHYKVSSTIKALFDTRKQGTLRRKFHDDQDGVFYFNGWFLSNEAHPQTISEAERRYKCIRGKDGKQIDEYAIQQGFRDRIAFYKHIANLDPRVLGLLLCRQDIRDFDPQRDAPQTMENVNQVTQSFEKLDPLKAFWYKILTHQLDEEIQVSVQELTSRVDNILTRNPSGVKQLVEDLTSAIRQKEPRLELWVLDETSPQEWKEIFQLLDAPHDSKELQDEIDYVKSEVVQRSLLEKIHVDDLEFSNFCKRVKNLLIEMHPTKLARFLRIKTQLKDDFYNNYFKPFFINLKKNDRYKTKTPRQIFWRDSTALFGSKFFEVKQQKSGKRALKFPPLEKVREIFSIHVFKNKNTFIDLINQGDCVY